MLFVDFDSLYNAVCKKHLPKTIFEITFYNMSLLGISNTIELIIKFKFLQSKQNLFERPKGLNKISFYNFKIKTHFRVF